MTAAVIPLHEAGQPFLVPAFDVLFNPNRRTQPDPSRPPAQPLPAVILRDVLEVTFQDALDRVDSFTLTLNNHNSTTLGAKYLGLDGDESLWELVQPGTEVQLLLGYRGEREDLRPMATGYISSLEADFPESGSPRLIVRALDVLDRLRVKQYTWSWPAARGATIRDSEIAQELAAAPDRPAGKPGLGMHVRIDDDALRREAPLDYVLMSNQYAIGFLVERARRLGYAVFVTRDEAGREELYFGPSDRVRDSTYVFEWGRSLTSVRPTISTVRQVKKVTVLGWDRGSKKQIRGEATVERDGGDLDPEVRALALANGREEVIADRPVRSQREAEQIARDVLHRQARELIEVTGTVVGLPDLRTGRQIRLGRLGTHLDGTYFVTETTHTLNDGGYRTTFKARREGPPA